MSIHKKSLPTMKNLYYQMMEDKWSTMISTATHYKKITEMLNPIKKLTRFSYEDQFLKNGNIKVTMALIRNSGLVKVPIIKKNGLRRLM